MVSQLQSIHKHGKKYYAGIGLVAAFGFVMVLYGDAAQSAVTTFRPIGNGIHNTWSIKQSKFSNGAGYTVVDDASCNGVTDYVYVQGSGTTTERTSFLFQLTGIPKGSTITSIAIVPCASNDKKSPSLAPSTLNTFAVVGGNLMDSSRTVLSGTTPIEITNIPALQNINYTTVSDGDTIYAGVRYYSGTSGVRLSNLKISVTYTPPSAYSQAQYYNQATYSYNQAQYYAEGSYATSTYSQPAYYNQSSYYSEGSYGTTTYNQASYYFQGTY